MTNYYERLTECAELLHDEGFDRRESPIIDVIAARDEIERLRAELKAKAEPPRPAAIVRTAKCLHMYEDYNEGRRCYMEQLQAGTDTSWHGFARGIDEVAWHPKSPCEHPAS